MLLSTALCLFFIAWSSAFLLDYLLRQRNCRGYVEFADRYGLVVSPFQLRMYTSRCDDPIISSSPPSSPFISIFYSVGAIAAVVSQIGITFYLSRLLITDFRSFLFPTTKQQTLDVPIPTDGVAISSNDDISDPHNGGVVPIVPGVNLPVEHIPLFMIVLIICAVFHELGHAWCARSKGVTVNGFGLFLLAIYPGAFTDIDSNSLERSPTWHRIQIFSAGVWHNLLLALFAYLLYSNSSTLLVPVYTTGHGVMITDVNPSSGLYGAGGLQLGDVVTAIDDCQVRSPSEWTWCIRRRRRSLDGKCVSAEKLWMYSSSVVEVTENEVSCCPNATVSHLCFESNAPVKATVVSTRPPPMVELAGGVILVAKKEETEQREVYACLNARETLEGESCNKTESCSGKGYRCAYAAVFNGTRLVKLSVEGKRNVLFVGSFNELLYMVENCSLSPRFTSFPLSLLSPYWLPGLIDLLAKYVLALSLALGLLNALPCFALDGQFILYTLIHSQLRSYMPKRRRSSVIRIILCYGTAVLVGNILFGFIRLYKSMTLNG